MPQWVEAVDPASGNKYWYDENDTNNVTWDDPRAGANVAEPMQQNAPEQYEAPPTMGGTATIQWIQATDPTSGRPYWYDANDHNNVTWEAPLGGGLVAQPQQQMPMPQMPMQQMPMQQMPMQQMPMQQMPLEATSRHFQTSRWGCCQGLDTCCMATFCSCVLFGQTMDRAKIMGCCPAGALLIGPAIAAYLMIDIIGFMMETDLRILSLFTFFFIQGCVGFNYRKQLVHKYHLTPWEGDGQEFCSWWCCPCCSAAQESATIMAMVALDGQWVEPAQMQTFVGVQPMAQPQPVYPQPQPGNVRITRAHNVTVVDLRTAQ